VTDDTGAISARDDDAIDCELHDCVAESSLPAGLITDDDPLRFFTVFEAVGMLG
jgi:hypothetical protein